MNNFKLLTETRTVITKWAVPCEAVLEELDTGIIFETCVEQVRDKDQVIQPLKAQVEFKKTLEFEDLTAEEQQEMSPTLYEATSSPLDHVMDAVETLLVQLPSQQVELSSSEALLMSIENLEALQRLITQRIEELKHY
jgi:hypothetical protein